jgi:hypothetical protein
LDKKKRNSKFLNGQSAKQESLSLTSSGGKSLLGTLLGETLVTEELGIQLINTKCQ